MAVERLQGPFTVLVVDDDYHVLRAIGAALEPLGTVLSADSGAAAVELVESSPPDLLVADLRLPDFSGIEVIARARVRAPELPAILLTSQAGTRDLVEAINRAEVYRFFEKPLDLDDLVHTARQALESVALRRERQRLHAELERGHAAMRALYHASRDLALASGRAEIVTSTLDHIAGAVPFQAAVVLAAPPPGRSATLHIHSLAPLTDEELDALRARALARFTALSGAVLDADQTRVVRIASAGLARTPGADRHCAEAPLEVPGAFFGILLLYRAAPEFTPEEIRLLRVLGNQVAQALRRDEEQRASQLRQLEILVGSMPDGVVMTNEDREVIVMNPAARRMLGFDPTTPVTAGALGERLGFDPFELVRLRRAGGEPPRTEIAIGGRTLHTIVSPVLDAAGGLAGLGILLRDFTAEKELERRKEEFVTVVSHELRTPLASMAGSLDLVLRGYTGELQPKQRHYLEMARHSCDKLHRMVDDLLDISKHESGHLELQLQRVDLERIVVEGVEKHRAAALNQSVTLVAEGHGAAMVAGDHDRLGQVVDNLLSNAIKFTPEGGRILVSLLRSERLPDHVGFAVWNSGPVLEEGQLERIFEKFHQLLVGTQRSGGTGLGLAIARGLVEIHGGRLWAERTLPDGLRLVAVFPRLEGAVAPPSLDREVEARLSETGLVGAGRPVLVAAGDPPTGSLVRGALSRYGVEALVAASPDEVLSLARQKTLALILFDSRADAPLLEVLSHDPDTAHIPRVVLDGAGGGIALPTPFGAARLAGAIAEALSRKPEAATPPPVPAQERPALPAREDPGSTDALEPELHALLWPSLDREIHARIEARVPFGYLDLGLEEIDDYQAIYGQVKADSVVRQVADLLIEVIRACELPSAQAAHLARSRFGVLVPPEAADRLAVRLVAALDRVLPLFYNQEDRERGLLRLPTADGTRDAPLMSGCVVAIIDRGGRFRDPLDLLDTARAVRHGRRRPGRSCYLRDDS